MVLEEYMRQLKDVDANDDEILKPTMMNGSKARKRILPIGLRHTASFSEG